jgi:hypothetical protein
MVDRDGRAGSEVLLDNEPWSEGQTILDAWQLPATDSMYSLRHFLFVIPPQ